MKAKRVWNTTGKGPGYYSLAYCLRLYQRLGHKPRKSGCDCCYYCAACDHQVIDDLRTQDSLDERCPKAKKGAKV